MDLEKIKRNIKFAVKSKGLKLGDVENEPDTLLDMYREKEKGSLSYDPTECKGDAND